MKKLIVALMMGAFLGTTSGCAPVVVEGDKTFVVTASKFIIGPNLEAAEAAVPDGAEIVYVAHTRGPILGLIQQTYISGTK